MCKTSSSLWLPLAKCLAPSWLSLSTCAAPCSWPPFGGKNVTGDSRAEIPLSGSASPLTYACATCSRRFINAAKSASILLMMNSDAGLFSRVPLLCRLHRRHDACPQQHQGADDDPVNRGMDDSRA